MTELYIKLFVYINTECAYNNTYCYGALHARALGLYRISPSNTLPIIAFAIIPEILFIGPIIIRPTIITLIPYFI